MNKQIISLSYLKFKEAIRDKLFIGVVFFFIFYLAFCIFLEKLSPGESEKVLRNAGLVGIELTSLILIIFSAILTFHREKETRILEVYLSFFRKAQYVTGNLLGYLAITLFYIFLSGVLYTIILLVYNSFNIAILSSLYTLFLKVSIIIGVSLLFSFLFTSPLIALLSTIFIYFSSEVVSYALEVVKLYGTKFQKIFIKFLYFILPNMDKLDTKYLATYGQIPSLNFFLHATIYTVVYILFLWLLCIIVLDRKEF